MFEREPAIDPNRSLWQSVLLRAVEDALIGVANENKQQNRVRICEEARRFLTKPNKDLSEVCALAGMDMVAVIEHMRARITDAPSPEELATTHRQNRQTFNRAPAKPKAKRIPFKDQQFTINGTTRTAAEWCGRTGIPLSLAYQRIRACWEPERAFTLTRQEACEEALAKARASYTALSHRIQIRNSEEASNPKRQPSASAPRYEHNGENLTLKEWAERTGIKKGTLYKRIVLSGWPIAEALSDRDARHKHLAKVA